MPRSDAWTRELGGDTALCSPDPDEIACWITEMMRSRQEERSKE